VGGYGPERLGVDFCSLLGGFVPPPRLGTVKPSWAQTCCPRSLWGKTEVFSKGPGFGPFTLYSLFRNGCGVEWVGPHDKPPKRHGKELESMDCP